MKEYTLEDNKNKILPWLSLFFLWLVISNLVNNDVIIPKIGITLENLGRIISSTHFIVTILWTFLRTIIVFLISTILAVILASLSSISKIVYSHIKPVISLMASVPILALILLALIWLDISLVSIFVGVFFILPIQFEKVLNTIQTVDIKLLQMSKIYKVSEWIKVLDIYIPSILIGLSSISTSTIASALKMVIAGEVLSQPRHSIGGNLILEKTYLNTPGVFAWIIIILIMSKALSLIIDFLREKSTLKEWM